MQVISGYKFKHAHKAGLKNYMTLFMFILFNCWYKLHEKEFSLLFIHKCVKYKWDTIELMTKVNSVVCEEESFTLLHCIIRAGDCKKGKWQS